MKIILLDYDNTLYSSTCPTLSEVDKNINLFIQKTLKIDRHNADIIRLGFYKKYGTTLQGLRFHHNIDENAYFNFIHKISPEFLPPPNPDLTTWLKQQKDPIFIFTNSRKDWVIKGFKAMDLLKISQIQDIFDIVFMDWTGKPNTSAYKKVESCLISRFGSDLEIYFADDSIRNLEYPKKMGWKTIWIHPLAVKIQGIDYAAEHLTDLTI